MNTDYLLHYKERMTAPKILYIFVATHIRTRLLGVLIEHVSALWLMKHIYAVQIMKLKINLKCFYCRSEAYVYMCDLSIEITYYFTTNLVFSSQLCNY